MALAHALAFRHAGAAISGVTSRTRHKADELSQILGGVSVYDGVQDLIDHERPDLIVISVSVLSIPAVTLECLGSGATLLIEKPAGLNLAEAQALAKKVDESGDKAFLALNRRCYASVRWVLDQVPEGLRYVRVQDQQSLTRAREFGHPEDVLAGWHFANSIHLVDLLRVFCRGAATAVDVLNPLVDGSGVLLAKVKFDSGDIGVYEAVWEGPGPWAASIHANGLRFHLQPLESATIQKLGVREALVMPVCDEDVDFKAGLVQQARETIEACQGRPSGLQSLKQGLATMELVHQIYAKNSAL